LQTIKGICVLEREAQTECDRELLAQRIKASETQEEEFQTTAHRVSAPQQSWRRVKVKHCEASGHSGLEMGSKNEYAL